MSVLGDNMVIFLTACLVVGVSIIKGCSHGKTLMVTNPGDYTTVVATNNERTCTSSWSEEKTHVYISDCETDDRIVVVFGDAKNAFKSGGSESGKWTMTIRCNPSPEVVETEYHNSPLNTDIREMIVLLPAVSESTSIEAECIWLIMVWLALKLL